ncbi:MazG-like family protein [Spirosoma taeanense]|uniref:MazG-like family protein n=1 Tax=Spirosoma taeanense TaxID=2735870 RepID=UPI0019624E5D
MFLWKSANQVDVQKLSHELADIMAYCLLLAHNHSVDLEQALRAKLEINKAKYPVDKAKGNAKKYTEL